VDVLDQILLIVSAIAAVVAALYAFRGDRFSRTSAYDAAEQRRLDIQPRLTVTWQGAMANGYKIIVGNGGGAARHLYWVGTDAAVFAARGIIPAHNTTVLVGVFLVGRVANPNPGIATIVWVAEDIQGGLYGADGTAITVSAAAYIRSELQQASFNQGALDEIIKALRL
jgi:homospermidine synthase